MPYCPQCRPEPVTTPYSLWYRRLKSPDTPFWVWFNKLDSRPMYNWGIVQFIQPRPRWVILFFTDRQTAYLVKHRGSSTWEIVTTGLWDEEPTNPRTLPSVSHL